MIGENVIDKKQNYELIRDKMLESMYNLRLSLVSLKLIGQKFIKKDNFKEMLDKEKQRINTQKVSDAIDDLFKDFFKKKEPFDVNYADDKKGVKDPSLKIQMPNTKPEN